MVVALVALLPACPTLGDWWFGVTDPAGVPITDATGLQVGKLTACHGCHIPRATDDFLFGVPKVDQINRVHAGTGRHPPRG
jgi:hypothetical protein